MRVRNLKPGFFTNELLGSCEPMAQLLYAGLWLIADKEGRLEDRPAWIKAQVFPHRDADVAKLLDTLGAMTDDEGIPFVKRYRAGNRRLIVIPKFREHQNPHPKELASKLPGPDEKPFIYTEAKLEAGHPHPHPHSSSSAAASGDVAAGKEKPGADCAALQKSLEAAGLAPAFAQKAVESSDPALIREVLAYHDDLRTPLRNPPGAIRSMLDKPEAWGFQQIDGVGWRRPASSDKLTKTTLELLAEQEAEQRARKGVKK